MLPNDFAGQPPALPWVSAEFDQVMVTLDRLAQALTPAPISVPALGESLGEAITGWRTLARAGGGTGLDRWSLAHLDDLAALEENWVGCSVGETLLHTDIRADNLLLAGDRVVVVDWPGACRGAAFVEPVLFAPSVAMQGGPDLPDLLALSGAGRSADRQALAAVLCAAAGYLTYRSLQPPPPGLLTVRAFQAAQADIARRWLAEFI